MAATATPTIADDFSRIRERIQDPQFLANKGLGNEIGFFVYPYPAQKELEVRAYTEALVNDSKNGLLAANVVQRNLWGVFEQIARGKRIWDRISDLESRRGTESLQKNLQRSIKPEDYVAAMDWEPHQPGRDVLLITGVGEAYPLVRAHSILENAQHVFEDVPVILMYPGRYDGQQLHLFGRLSDGNYYRAFNLL